MHPRFAEHREAYPVMGSSNRANDTKRKIQVRIKSSPTKVPDKIEDFFA